MVDEEIEYFTQRAGDEVAAAIGATHPNARNAHLELAKRYLDMADALRKSGFGYQSGGAAIGAGWRLIQGGETPESEQCRA